MGGVVSVGSWVSGWRRSNFGIGGVGQNLGVGGVDQKLTWVNVLLFDHTLFNLFRTSLIQMKLGCDAFLDYQICSPSNFSKSVIISFA